MYYCVGKSFINLKIIIPRLAWWHMSVVRAIQEAKSVLGLSSGVPDQSMLHNDNLS
jgi:hypothetical protein